MVKRQIVGGDAVFVRRAVFQDAPGIHLAHMKSIQEICSKEHSADEIKSWGHRPYREDQRVGAIKNDLVWVVESNGSIEGYGHLKLLERDGLKSGYVAGLYLTPQVAGKSLGKVIIELMVEEAKVAKARKLTLESSINARSFYRKMGFVDDGPQATVEIAGVPIRCFPMSMEIEVQLP